MKKYLVPMLLGITAVITVYGARQIYLLYQAAFKIVGAKINKIGISGIDMILYAEIDNKGDISAQINDQHYEVFLNKTKVSTVDAKQEVHINSNGKTIIPIHVAFNPETILMAGADNILNLLTDKSKIKIEIKGNLSLKSGVISLKDYPVDITYTLQEIIDSSKQPAPTV